MLFFGIIFNCGKINIRLNPLTISQRSVQGHRPHVQLQNVPSPHGDPVPVTHGPLPASPAPAPPSALCVCESDHSRSSCVWGPHAWCCGQGLLWGGRTPTPGLGLGGRLGPKEGGLGSRWRCRGFGPQGQLGVCYQHLLVSWEIRLGSVIVPGNQSCNSLLCTRGVSRFLSLPPCFWFPSAAPPGAAAPQSLHLGSRAP